MSVDLLRALRATRGSRMAFVGSGGKTTAIFQLAHCFSNNSVWITTTTHLAEKQAEYAKFHHVIARSQCIPADDKWKLPGIHLITGFFDSGSKKWTGIDERQFNELAQFGEGWSIPILVEADGSRIRSLKAPADHEPAIPEGITDVVLVVGLSGLGKHLSDTIVHRPELFSRVTGLEVGGIIYDETIVNYLLSRSGGLKGIPQYARKILILNQADTDDLVLVAKKMIDRVLGVYNSCIIARLNDSAQSNRVIRVHEPSLGVILAAGKSTRMPEDTPKQLLDWHGIPLIRHVAIQAMQSDFDKVCVVIPDQRNDIKCVLADLPVDIIENSSWQSGQSSSLRIAINQYQQLFPTLGFLLCDQPFISPSIINLLLDKKQTTCAPIVAPRVNGKRGHPVLFDQSTYKDLAQVTGDVGGRSLLDNHPVEWVDVEYEKILIDIDTLEDYSAAIELLQAGEN